MTYVHIIKKGYSLLMSYKGWYIGSISAIKEDVEVLIDSVGSTLYIRYDNGNGFIQYVSDYIEDKLITE